MEKVSVIIPTYNREKTIVRALDSVLKQTYTNLEVLIIDDGSTDNTAEVIKEIADERVTYKVLEKNGGAAYARNVGIRMAAGEWIAFQDSDDVWYPDKIEKQILYMQAHPNYEMVYGLYQVHFENGDTVTVPMEPLPKVMEGELLATLLERNVIGAPVLFGRRECIQELGGFDTSYKALEDWEFVIRFAEKYQIGFLPEVLMDVYMLRGGVSSNLGAYYEGRCKMLAAYKEEMVQAGVLDRVMMDILTRAQKSGTLEMVKKMMMLYLGKG